MGGQQTYSLYGGLSISSSTTEQITKYGGYNPATDRKNSPLAKFAQVTGWTQLQQSWNAPGATTLSRLEALGRFGLTNANNLLQLAAIFGGPEDEGVAAADEAPTAEEALSAARMNPNDIRFSQYTYQQAGVPISVVSAAPQEILPEIWKFSTQNFGVSITIKP